MTCGECEKADAWTEGVMHLARTMNCSVGSGLLEQNPYLDSDAHPPTPANVECVVTDKRAHLTNAERERLRHWLRDGQKGGIQTLGKHVERILANRLDEVQSEQKNGGPPGAPVSPDGTHALLQETPLAALAERDEANAELAHAGRKTARVALDVEEITERDRTVSRLRLLRAEDERRTLRWHDRAESAEAARHQLINKMLSIESNYDHSRDCTSFDGDECDCWKALMVESVRSAAEAVE